ncbi:MAG: hypothetical protein CG439_2543 [Methylococcaceae bacterium NSP1-2]|nr:DUF4157 domain-containing protein [Methylococcaceae bacterium]OYV15540.1 MAG: hypothetical protein CG439_2543 [Methylococcaceae bacterium NSP1-2]
MKTSAEKSSSTPSKTATQSAQPFFAKANTGNFFAPAIQMKMTVNQPNDKFEQEADKMADKIMRMPSSTPMTGKEEKVQRQPAEKLQKKEEDKIQKAAMPEEKVQKKVDDKLQKAPVPEQKLQRKEKAGKADGVPTISANLQTIIQTKVASGGQPLSGDVRNDMEARFNADFSKVRIHNDADSAKLNNYLSAKAFTYQNHVFFSSGQYQPGSSAGKQLLAHELTHTIQQGHAAQRSSPQVSTTVTAPVQRFLGIDIPSWQDVIDWLADKAYNIPGYRMFTFLPGGKIITDALEKYNVFEKAGSWIEGKLKRFANLLGNIKSAIGQFLDDLDFLDIILHPVRTWERAVDIFTTPVKDIISFIVGIFQEILQFIRDAVLMPLAALAKDTRGFDLLCALLGKNPITGQVVPRTPDTLIGGFMKLIGQEEIWENIKKGNAIQKAWLWFQNAMQGLFAIVAQFPLDFIAMLKSLEVMDFIILPNLFIKVLKVFGNFIVNFTKWALNTVLDLLEIIFSVVAPKAVPYVAKAKSTFITIIKNPIGFVGNLVRAGKQGFELFKSRIGEHLKTALIKWITGPLGDAGVYIPKSFDLMEIIKLVLSVLGLTWQNIRAKLVTIIPEPVLAGLEKTAKILVTLVKDGPVAAWEEIKAELEDLKGQLIKQVTEMITTEIVKAAVVKLVSMLNPAGAVIQAILAIWNTVSFFIQKIQQIAAVVASFLDSIAAIAAGQVANAAKKVEQTMANTLTVIIAFLAKFAGLGNIPEKIVGIIKKIRQPIDKGLDKIVAWLGGLLKKIGGAILGTGKDKVDNRTPEEKQKALSSALNESNILLNDDNLGKEEVQEKLPNIQKKYQLKSLTLLVDNDTDIESLIHVHGEVNPVTDTEKKKKPKKPPVKTGDKVQIIYNGDWSVDFIKITNQVNQYKYEASGKIDKNQVSKPLFSKDYGKEWRKYNPYKTGDAWEAIKNLNAWSIYKDASQTLSYRKHARFNVPEGKNWHHIHEQNNGGPNTLPNLALVDSGLNQGFLNAYFTKSYPETAGLPLRQFLKGKSHAEHMTWGLKAIDAAGKSLTSNKDEGRGPYNEIVSYPVFNLAIPSLYDLIIRENEDSVNFL